MEFNEKDYKLITDKGGGLDCEDCSFIGKECPEWALDKCNMHQVWEKCAQARNTPTSDESNCNTPLVSKCEGIENEAQLIAFISWYEKLSVEEIVWYDGKLLEAFKKAINCC